MNARNVNVLEETLLLHSPYPQTLIDIINSMYG
jgi:hypothetical protein